MWILLLENDIYVISKFLKTLKQYLKFVRIKKKISLNKNILAECSYIHKLKLCT